MPSASSSIFGASLSRITLSVALLTVMAGCATAPGSKPAEATVPPTPTLQQFLDEAAKAKAEGGREKERSTYRAAAAAHPTSKEPWLKLAEGYFEDSDYGNTILSSQEVLHRDNADTTANSLLAVSGLRVASSALGALREQRNLGADTRKQAEGVAQVLRDVLGEPVIVPKQEVPPVTVKRPATKQASKATASAPSTAVVPAPTSAPTVAPAPAPAAPSGKPSSPFDKLK